METHVPDVELFIVFKWLIVLLVGAGVAQLSALAVKRWWYGKEKHDRRDDADEARGWIERFLENQKDYTEAVVGLRTDFQKIIEALNANGKLIQDFTKSAECKFDERDRR